MKARMVMNHRADGEHTSTPELVEAGAESEEDDHEGLVPTEHGAGIAHCMAYWFRPSGFPT